MAEILDFSTNRFSSGSIMDNIAEVFEWDRNKEFINFLCMSKGPCGEVRPQNDERWIVG